VPRGQRGLARLCRGKRGRYEAGALSFDGSPRREVLLANVGKILKMSRSVLLGDAVSFVILWRLRTHW
jgi:hypothetical protein